MYFFSIWGFEVRERERRKGNESTTRYKVHLGLLFLISYLIIKVEIKMVVYRPSINNSTSKVCYYKMVGKPYLWEGVPPLIGPLPKLTAQMTLAIASNQFCFLVFQKFHQPRIISDIIGGLLISPSLLGAINKNLPFIIWPEMSWATLETVANMGLAYTMFIEGLHMDLSPITKRGTRTTCLVIATLVLPFCVGYGLYYVFPREEDGNSVVAIYWGTILGSTSFSTLASVIAKLKILCNDLGREALSVGMINDVVSWLLAVFVLAVTGKTPRKASVLSRETLWVLSCSVAFVMFCFLVVRPLFERKATQKRKGEEFSDSTIQFILLSVLACGFVTDYIGSYFPLGTFVLGMCIPDGALSLSLIQKIEECILGLLMPLYFVVITRKVDVFVFLADTVNIAVLFLALLIKVVCASVASLFCDLQIPDSLALGLLLGAKGLLPMVIINIGHERQLLSHGAFSSMLLVIFASTVVVGPTMGFFYKRMMKSNSIYDKRTIQEVTIHDEFRVITCIHGANNVSSIVNLLEILNQTTKLPVSVFALHLVELIGRASAMLIVHESRDSSSTSGLSTRSFFNRTRLQSEQIIKAFENFEYHQNGKVSVQSLTIVSPLDSMHEDIRKIAEDKRATLIILPFHRQQDRDGNLEETNIEFRAINQYVMGLAPCSVGLLVDRGLGILSLEPSMVEDESNIRNKEPTHIAMIFIGGPDDREALFYAWRMANHPLVSLTVIRFIVGHNALDIDALEFLCSDDDEILTTKTKFEREKEINEIFINMFRRKTIDVESIVYIEKVSNNGAETINLLRAMNCFYDFYVVGRGKSMLSPLTTGLAEWSDCPELGIIGDVLTTSDLAPHSSVLIIQQYDDGQTSEDGMRTSSKVHSTVQF